jgi:hypothetical protein
MMVFFIPSIISSPRFPISIVVEDFRAAAALATNVVLVAADELQDRAHYISNSFDDE